MLPRAHCGDQETEVREDSFQVSEIPRLVIRNHNGSVTVKSSIDLRTVDVIATLSNPNRVDYRAEQMGNTVVITVNVKNGFRLFGKSGGANIEVAVPEIIDLDLESDNGKVTAENITGLVSAETSNGRITLDGITGSASAMTSNGKIEISRFRGELEAQTSNGAIDFEGALSPGSDNRLSTSNGGVVCGGLPTFQEVGHEHLNMLPTDVGNVLGHTLIYQIAVELLSSAHLGIEGPRTQAFGPDVSTERIDIDAQVTT